MSPPSSARAGPGAIATAASTVDATKPAAFRRDVFLSKTDLLIAIDADEARGTMTISRPTLDTVGQHARG